MSRKISKHIDATEMQSLAESLEAGWTPEQKRQRFRYFEVIEEGFGDGAQLVVRLQPSLARWLDARVVQAQCDRPQPRRTRQLTRSDLVREMLIDMMMADEKSRASNTTNDA